MKRFTEFSEMGQGEIEALAIMFLLVIVIAVVVGMLLSVGNTDGQGAVIRLYSWLRSGGLAP
jgi:hypothetical protein